MQTKRRAERLGWLYMRLTLIASHSLSPSLAFITPAKWQSQTFQAWAELAWPLLRGSFGHSLHASPHKAIKDNPTSLVLNICFGGIHTYGAILIEFSKNLYSADLVRSLRVLTCVVANDESGWKNPPVHCTFNIIQHRVRAVSEGRPLSPAHLSNDKD